MDEAKAKWAPYATKYEIHTETYQLQAMVDGMDMEECDSLSIEGVRKQMHQTEMKLQGTVDFVGVATEMTVPSPHDPEGIAVTVYKPETCVKNPAILVYFHGGGLIWGSRQSLEATVKVIAMESGSIVVNSSYRLLPNKDSPCAPFEDGVAVTRWVMANKTVVGGTESSKVGVGGDSSGGHLSACVTNEVTDLDFQVLVYPLADTSLSQESCREFEDLPYLDLKTLRWVIDNSMAHIPNHEKDPRYNPMARTNTELSPPALFVLAELDPLIGCGLEYAEKLRTAGVPVQCEILRGVPHDVFISRTVMETMSARAFSFVTNFLKKFQA
ncbi:hypothetical protein RRG08_010082 [Elysia crispata]|uniref:Alpha/beta hydrolase fold-3 domain-containing protein n=1 Tax=Elysia crispata TaxID=231223 RepID=A0AAE1A5K2_9GAST|nr:hypothetical protein RRG08_010082 [Elysia crispata]